MKTVLLRGRGVCTRLHEPVLSRLGGIDFSYVDRDDTPSSPAKSDLLVIGSPPSAHEEELIRLHARSRAVLIEKPMGHNLAAAERIHDLVCRWKQPVFANYQLRKHNVLVEMKKLISSLCGRIRILYRSAAWLQQIQGDLWYQHLSEGGTCLYAVGSHIIDLVLAAGLCVDGVSLRSGTRTLSKATIEMSCGAIGVIIDINLEALHEQFSLDVVEDGGALPRNVYDLISAQWGANCPEYPKGSLRSSQRHGIWQACQKHVYRELLEHPEDARGMANTADAIKVHRVLEGLKADYAARFR
ncbi:MAG: Gfo/Idh/MocA family oxidoreductase [Acidobacteriia bacterium]|nr:Gfo/Idh/MocA family oxidoreductase [Terriglobia bacterium]